LLAHCTKPKHLNSTFAENLKLRMLEKLEGKPLPPHPAPRTVLRYADKVAAQNAAAAAAAATAAAAGPAKSSPSS
jgi:hypothetical protein